MTRQKITVEQNNLFRLRLERKNENKRFKSFKNSKYVEVESADELLTIDY